MSVAKKFRQSTILSSATVNSLNYGVAGVFSGSASLSNNVSSATAVTGLSFVSAGHNNNNDSAIHPVSVITNSVTNGSASLLNNSNGVYGLTLTSTSSFGKSYVMHYTITSW